jgi:hypothetical protein
VIQGKVGKSIFLMHYFKENPKLLGDKILDLLPTLEKTFLISKMEMAITK